MNLEEGLKVKKYQCCANGGLEPIRTR